MSEIFNTILFYPFLNLLLTFYHLLGDNLGLAIIFIAILVRLLLIPLTRKQTETTQKMASLQPELQKLQKKYSNNQQKLSEEQMKLYKKVGYNPLGCVGTMIPMLVILSALYGVIKAVSESDFNGIYPFIQDWVYGSADPSINVNFLWWDLRESYNSVSALTSKFSIEALPYFILALLVGVSQYLATEISQRIQKHGTSSTKKKKNEPMSQQEMQDKMNKYMMALFPVMTIFLAFSYSSALSVYWMVQSFALVIQYLLLDTTKSKSFLKSSFFRQDSCKKKNR